MNNGLTFDSQTCRNCADALNKSAANITKILEEEFRNQIAAAMNVYQSAAADEIKAAFDSVATKFPDFIGSVTSCANYLENTVAPTYEALEAKVQENVQI